MTTEQIANTIQSEMHDGQSLHEEFLILIKWLVRAYPELTNDNKQLRSSLAEAQKMIEDVSLWAGDGTIPPSKRLEGIQRSIGPGNPPRSELLAERREKP